MAEGRRTKLKEIEDRPEMKVELSSEPADTPDKPLTPEQIYLRRKAQVLQQDNEDFSRYLQEKKARDEHEAAQTADAPRNAPGKLNRRTVLTWAAGTAVVGEAAVLGYPMVTGQNTTRQNIPDQGLRHAGVTYTEPQRHPIDRELINPQADISGRKFGNWVLLSAPRARRSNGKWCRWASCSSRRARSPATTCMASPAPTAPSGIPAAAGRQP